MSKIYMTPEGKYINVTESQNTWVTGFSFEVNYVDDINQASVFGLGGECWLGQRQPEFRTLMKKVQKECIPVKAKLEIERKVVLIKDEDDVVK